MTWTWMEDPGRFAKLTYKAGDLVWARVKGYPWWPAKVLAEEALPPRSDFNQQPGLDYPVIFYGTLDYLYVKPEHLRPFKEFEAEFSKLAKKKDHKLALEQIRNDPTCVDRDFDDDFEIIEEQTVIETIKKKRKRTESYKDNVLETPFAENITKEEPERNQKKIISSKKLEMGKYYDFIVIDSNGQEYFLHKMILACHSNYFKTMFDLQFRNSQIQKLQLIFPDPQRVLSQIFQYMYTYQLSIQPETIVPLLHQAEYYQISELIDSLKKEVKEVYLPKFVLQILRDSVRYKMPEMIELSSGVLAENFDAVEWELYGEDLNFLPLETLKYILTRPSLPLNSEYRVYNIISNYLIDWKKKPKNIRALEDEKEVFNNERCHELYNLINFEKLTPEQLEEAYQNENVPRDLLFQGVLTALRTALNNSNN